MLRGRMRDQMLEREDVVFPTKEREREREESL